MLFKRDREERLWGAFDIKRVDSMIVFDLRCSSGHTFEGWFEDGAAFEKQRAGGQIACPLCESTAVTKAPCAVAIKTSSRSACAVDEQVQMVRTLKKIADYVEIHFDNVGSDFAKEALKIHYGVSKPRSIRGVSTATEEKMLADEGVPFLKFPLPVRQDPDPSPSDANE
jgi:hypothetical protein